MLPGLYRTKATNQALYQVLILSIYSNKIEKLFKITYLSRSVAKSTKLNPNAIDIRGMTIEKGKKTEKLNPNVIYCAIEPNLT